jgi:hypothetical protein
VLHHVKQEKQELLEELEDKGELPVACVSSRRCCVLSEPRKRSQD